MSERVRACVLWTYTVRVYIIHIVVCGFDEISVYTRERGRKQIVHFPGRTLRDVQKARFPPCLFHPPIDACLRVRASVYIQLHIYATTTECAGARVYVILYKYIYMYNYHWCNMYICVCVLQTRPPLPLQLPYKHNECLIESACLLSRSYHAAEIPGAGASVYL